MTEQNTKIGGRTKRALDTTIAKRQVSQESYRAVLAGEITLKQAKAIGRDGAPAADTGQGHSGPGTATGRARGVSAGDDQDGVDMPPSPSLDSRRMTEPRNVGVIARNSPRRTGVGNQVTIRGQRGSSGER